MIEKSSWRMLVYESCLAEQKKTFLNYQQNVFKNHNVIRLTFLTKCVNEFNSINKTLKNICNGLNFN